MDSGSTETHIENPPQSSTSTTSSSSKKTSTKKSSSGKSKSSSSSGKSSKSSRKLDLPRPEPEDNPQASAIAHEQMMQDLAGSMAPPTIEEGGGFGSSLAYTYDAGIEPVETKPYYGNNDNDQFFMQEIDNSISGSGDTSMMDTTDGGSGVGGSMYEPDPVENFDDPDMFATMHADPDMTFMGQPGMELCEFWTMGRKGGIVVSRRYDTAARDVRQTLNFGPGEDIRVDSLITDRAYAWPLGQPTLASTKSMYMEEELYEPSLWTGFFSLTDFERARLFSDGNSVRAFNDCVGTSRDGCMTVCAVAGNRAQAVELMKHMLCMMYRSNLDSGKDNNNQEETSPDELLERLIETRVQQHQIVPQIISW